MWRGEGRQAWAGGDWGDGGVRGRGGRRWPWLYGWGQVLLLGWAGHVHSWGCMRVRSITELIQTWLCLPASTGLCHTPIYRYTGPIQVPPSPPSPNPQSLCSFTSSPFAQSRTPPLTPPLGHHQHTFALVSQSVRRPLVRSPTCTHDRIPAASLVFGGVPRR